MKEGAIENVINLWIEYAWNFNSERVKHKTASTDIICASHNSNMPKGIFSDSEA